LAPRVTPGRTFGGPNMTSSARAEHATLRVCDTPAAHAQPTPLPIDDDRRQLGSERSCERLPGDEGEEPRASNTLREGLRAVPTAGRPAWRV
jgi:hypothetical protein